MSAEVELRMLEGSEFQTVGAAMLKPREAKVVRTRGTDKRLVLVNFAISNYTFYLIDKRLFI